MKSSITKLILLSVVFSFFTPFQHSHAADPVWSNLGGQPSSSVHALFVSESTLYVGGVFTSGPSSSGPRISKWDGSSWSPLGSGIGSANNLNTSIYVSAIAASGSNVYAGGSFNISNGDIFDRIAKWDGSSWSALGSGVGNGVVNAIAISGSDVYVGGSFTTAGGVSASRIAKWNGSSWSALGSGVGGVVNAIAVAGSDVYVGGSFTTAGGNTANRIAKWDGSSWSALSVGLNSEVKTIAVSGSDVYVGGLFTDAGGLTANRVAKWSGSSWSALGSGVDSEVSTVAVSGSDVYLGGSFTTAGDVSVSRIAKWNGSSWSALGNGIAPITGLNTVPVKAITLYGSDVIVGGQNSGANRTAVVKVCNSSNLARFGVDTTAPKISFPNIRNTTSSQTTLYFSPSEAGTYYYLIYPASDLAPDTATVLAQGSAIAKTSNSFDSCNQITWTATGLDTSTSYKAYLVLKDDSENYSTVGSFTFTTTAESIPPILSSASVSGTTSSGTTLNFTSDEAGTYSYLVYTAADAAPNAVTVVAQGSAVTKGTNSAGIGQNNATVIGLTPSTSYKAYVVVSDVAGNNSDVSVITFTTSSIPNNSPINTVVIPAYRLTYFGNSTDAVKLPYESNPFVEGEKVIVSKQSPSRTGYTFMGWNTAANGSGIKYSTGDSITITDKEIDLFAQWQINSYPLTFDANGGMALKLNSFRQEYLTSIKIPVISIADSNPGYSFVGWNSKPDGSGSQYRTGETFFFSPDTPILYAQWEINSYSVSYNGNGHKFGIVPPAHSLNFGRSHVVRQSDRTLKRPGFIFDGWNTAKDGSGKTYKPGDTFEVGISDQVFFANWRPITYTVKYLTAFSREILSSQFVAEGKIEKAPTPPTRKGYIFKGWSNQPSKQNILEFPFSPGVNRNITLYAVWVKK